MTSGYDWLKAERDTLDAALEYASNEEELYHVGTEAICLIDKLLALLKEG